MEGSTHSLYTANAFPQTDLTEVHDDPRTLGATSSRVELSSRLRSLLLDDSLLSSTPSELDAGLALARKGVHVLKVGRSGRAQKRFVHVTENLDAIVYSSRRKALSDCTFNFADIARIQRGQHTSSFGRFQSRNGGGGSRSTALSSESTQSITSSSTTTTSTASPFTTNFSTVLEQTSLSIVPSSGGRTLDLIFDNCEPASASSSALSDFTLFFTTLQALLLRSHAAIEDHEIRFLRRVVSSTNSSSQTNTFNSTNPSSSSSHLNTLSLDATRRALLQARAIPATHGASTVECASFYTFFSELVAESSSSSPSSSSSSLTFDGLTRLVDLIRGRDRADTLFVFNLIATEETLLCKTRMSRGETRRCDEDGKMARNTTVETQDINEHEQERERGKVVTSESFLQFLIKEQGQVDATIQIAQRLCSLYEPVSNGQWMSITAFSAYLSSLNNSAYSPDSSCLGGVEKNVKRYMSHPLSAYWISSSHNTYLEGNQLQGASSVSAYLTAVQKGIRCVELDCWDGSNGEPLVYHGHTLTQRVLFKDVVTALAQYAFRTTPFPVILSLEVHCSPLQQTRMGELLIQAFGDSLVIDRGGGDFLPSPFQLQGKVIVKAKLKRLQSRQSGGSSAASLFNGEDNVHGGKSSLPLSFSSISLIKSPLHSSSPPPTLPLPLAPLAPLISSLLPIIRDSSEERRSGSPSVQAASCDATQHLDSLNSHTISSKQLSVLNRVDPRVVDSPLLFSQVHLHTVKFKEAIESGMVRSSVRNDAWTMSSCKETKAWKFITSGGENMMTSISPNTTTTTTTALDAMIDHTMNRLVRVYPGAFRIDSSNFNPAPFWASGVQMAALNTQTCGVANRLNQALFRQNGKTGYVLKPERMRRSSLMMINSSTSTTSNVNAYAPGGSTSSSILDAVVVDIVTNPVVLGLIPKRNDENKSGEEISLLSNVASSSIPTLDRHNDDRLGDGETRLWQEKRLFTWIRQCDRRSRLQKSFEASSQQQADRKVIDVGEATNLKKKDVAASDVNEVSVVTAVPELTSSLNITPPLMTTDVPSHGVTPSPSYSRGDSSLQLYASSLLLYPRMKTALEGTAAIKQTLEICLLGGWALPSLSPSSSSSSSVSNDASSAFSLNPSSSVYCSLSIWGENCDSQKYKSRLVHSAHVKSTSDIGSISEGFPSTSAPTANYSCPSPFWNESFQFQLTKADVAMLYITVHEAPLSAVGAATSSSNGMINTPTTAAAAALTSTTTSSVGAHSTTFVDSDDASFLAYFAAPVSCLRGGYRCLQLRDAKGKKLGALSTLLCRFRLF